MALQDVFQKDVFTSSPGFLFILILIILIAIILFPLWLLNSPGSTEEKA